MKFHREQTEEELPNSLISMVDVVFILLAFFVLTATFGRERDVAMGVEQPTRAGASAHSGDLPQRIVVFLNAAEGDKVRITLGQVSLNDGDFPALSAKLGEINLPNVPVVIAADPRLAMSHVAAALDAVLLSPMKKVSLTKLETSASDP